MYGGEEGDAALVQLEDGSRVEDKVGKDTGEDEGSRVTEEETFFSREEMGKDREAMSSEAFSEVMISPRRAWSGWKMRTQRGKMTTCHDLDCQKNSRPEQKFMSNFKWSIL